MLETAKTTLQISLCSQQQFQTPSAMLQKKKKKKEQTYITAACMYYVLQSQYLQILCRSVRQVVENVKENILFKIQQNIAYFKAF